MDGDRKREMEKSSVGRPHYLRQESFGKFGKHIRLLRHTQYLLTVLRCNCDCIVESWKGSDCIYLIPLHVLLVDDITHPHISYYGDTVTGSEAIDHIVEKPHAYRCRGSEITIFTCTPCNT